MKNYLIPLVCFAIPFLLSAQQNPSNLTRDHVLMEVFAGTCCPNLPGVEMALEEIIENQDPLVIVRHDFCNTSNGLYENEHAIARFNYYGSTGDPVAFLNGTAQITGGGTSSMYDEYMYYVPSLIGETTAFDLQISLENIAGNQFVAHVTAEKTDPASPVDNLTLQLALTALEIENTWSSWDIDIFHCIQVDMFPDHNGTIVDFSQGFNQNFTIPFTVDTSLATPPYKLIGFLQDNSLHQIVQDFVIDLNFPLHPDDALLTEVKNIPNALCNGNIAPEITIQNKGFQTLNSVTINFEADDELVHSYQWTGNLLYWQKELVLIPQFEAGIPYNNEIKIYTSMPNGNPDNNPENDSLLVELEAVPPTSMYLFLKFTSDDKPFETSWELFGPDGTVVQYCNSYTLPNHFYRDTLFISDEGCHTFVLHDSGGDGLDGELVLTSSDYYWQEIFYSGRFYYTTSCQVEVTEAIPSPAFTANATEICEGESVAFSNTSTGTVEFRKWYFEGGNPETSYQQNPTVIYNNQGNFDVQLIIWSGIFKDTLLIKDYINVASIPDVQFNALPDQCINWPPLELTQGLPEGGVYSGEFVENGFFYPEQAGTGYHEIQYKYTNEGGCADSASQTIYVDACVGTGEVKPHDVISLFPNPVERNGLLHVTCDEGGLISMNAISENGRVISLYDGVISATSPIKINLKNHDVTPGIYVLNLSLHKKQFYHKLIVK